MSIFPEYAIIGRKGLIRRWIGEGFVHKEDRYTVHEIGEKYFNELLNRSLIQPVKINQHGRVKTCRVHNIILDFIISKSIEENFVTLVGVPILTNRTENKVVRRLSLQLNKQGNSTIPTSGLVFSHVRSVNVFIFSVEIPLQKFVHLRVLDFEYCNLKNHHIEDIVMLIHLRYLNLKRTGISELPKQIGRLGCLEMLDIRCNGVEELPASIVNLGKLSHLLADGYIKFPDGIAKMQALETLKAITVYIQGFDFLLGLGQLKNLRNLVLQEIDVDSYSDTDMVECGRVMVSSQCKLGNQNLRSLNLRNGSSLLQEPLCIVTLEKLITKSSAVTRVPEWVSSLRNLQQLRLEVEVVKQDDLCILGALPALLILYLEVVTKSNERLRISGEIGFRFLRYFIYEVSYQPVDLMFAEGSMPKLEKLELKVLRVAEADSLEFGIKNLPCLSIVKCEVICDDDDYGDVETAMERATSTHPNHPTLLFSSLGW
jgi:disease resistance protein RPM1